MFEWSELTAVTDLASAKAAIELIVEQGEGARGHWRDAHFGKFLALAGGLPGDQGGRPGLRAGPPGRARLRAPPPHVEAATLTITDPLTAQVADLFNAKHLMNWVMRPLGSLLTTLPVGPDRPRGADGSGV